MSKPGEVFDRNGVPIYPGDLIRSPHFRDKRRRQHYLYHVAVFDNDEHWMRMVPTCWLEPTKNDGTGACRLTQELVNEAEVISGYGPGTYLDFMDRPRKR